MQLAGVVELVNVAAVVKILAGLFVFYCLSCAFYNRFLHPYRRFPGPFWGSITPLWYWRAARFARSQDTGLPLHEKYGPIVRISPNQVQIADPKEIETIYGPSNVFEKDKFYSGFAPGISKRAGLFEERDEKAHAIRRRIVAPLYTQGSILQFEPCVDRVIALFYDRMEQMAKTGEEFDMGTWLRKYTFDVIGEIFYGRKGGFGFLRDNIDYNNWCLLMETMAAPAGSNTSVPWGFRNLFFMAEMLWPSTRIGASGFFEVIKQAHAAVDQRVKERASGDKKANANDLNRLLDLVNNDPDPKKYWDIKDVTAEIWTMIWAGSDTTAISMNSAFYHLHKNPETLAKLRQELEEAFATGRLSYPIRYTDGIKLPYLHAVVREAMRMHSALGFGLPRVVPKTGTTICNEYLPAGYGIMINQNAIAFSKEIFGLDAHSFNPERWLHDKERADYMERHMLHFGYGPRVCIGKHIASVEMYKLLPVVLRDFEFEGVGPGEKEWRITASWFYHQKGVDVRVKRRRAREGGEVVVIPEGRWAEE